MTFVGPLRFCTAARFLTSLLALSLSACAGDPNVSFDALRLDSDNEAGETSSGGSSSGAGGAVSLPDGGKSGSTGGAGGAAAGASAAGGPIGGGGGVAGSSGAGGAGTAGDGGGPVAGAGGGAPALPRLDLIDDVEGAYPMLPQRAGRNGLWYMAHDDTYGEAYSGAAPLLNPEQRGSQYAARISGSGFTSWGVQLGVSLRAPSTGYDASGYCGVRFMAKGTGPTWTLLISDRLSVPQGGVCGAPDTEACYHFVGKSFPVGAVWQEVAIGFDELLPLLDATGPRRLDAAAIYDIAFNLHNAQGGAFELLVDDLSFIEPSAGGCAP